MKNITYVRITKGQGWREGLEGLVFPVYKKIRKEKTQHIYQTIWSSLLIKLITPQIVLFALTKRISIKIPLNAFRFYRHSHEKKTLGVFLRAQLFCISLEYSDLEALRRFCSGQ